MSADWRRWLYAPAGWVFLIYAVIGAAAAWWLGTYPSVSWARDATRLIPLLIAVVVAAWIVTQALWLISDRTIGIFHGIFLGLMACGLLALLIGAREQQFEHDVRVAAEIREAREALRRRSFEQAKEALDAIAARRDRLQEDRFLQYQGRVPPEVLDQMRAVDAEIVGGLREAAEHYESVLASNETRGPESWLRIAERAELEAERARNVAIYEAGRVYLEYLQGLETRYNDRLEALDLPPPADRYAVAEMTRVLQFWTYSGAMRIREIDVEISAIAIRALDLLLRNWESWRFDRATSRVIFDDGSVEMAFMQLLAEASELVSQQVELRRRLQRAMEESGAGDSDPGGAE